MEEHNLIETVCYKRRRKSIAKNPVTKNKIVSFVSTVNSQGTAEIQRTADFQGTADPHDAASIP
ncbi:hypothetical protein Tco_0325336, partial [Tanacetum coccineum]